MGPPRSTSREAGPARRALAIAALFALVLGATALRYRGPPPRGAEAPPLEFSEARARAVLQRILAEPLPHPVGTAANARVRDRLVGELRRLGYSPELQQAFSCGSCGGCATVTNVLARLDGTDGAGGAILLAAHYDSAGAGPGGADDGAGVAALLEVARILKAQGPSRHPIVLLLTDGEEAGELGSRAFIHGHPWAKELRVALNVEARGSGGPSLMFQTSRMNARLVEVFARHARYPVANSLFEAIYSGMGHDTDLDSFVEAGLQGYNFGFIGEGAHYHTSLDTLELLDPRSLQHHGDNVLDVLRGLQQSALPAPAEGDAVFFDVLGLTLLWWPGGLTFPLCLAALLLLGAGLVRLVRRGLMGGRELAWGALGFVLSLPLAAAAALAVGLVLERLGAMPRPWWPTAPLALFAFGGLGLIANGLLGGWLEGRAGRWGLWGGCWVSLGLLAFACALGLPGGSFLFLPPTLAAGGASLWAGARGDRQEGPRGVALLLPLVVMFVLWIPAGWWVYQALGAQPPPVWPVIGALVFAPAVPVSAWLFRSRGKRLCAGALLAAACVAVAVAPRTSRLDPDRVVLEFFRDANDRQTRWVAFEDGPALPEALRSSSPFGGRTRIEPWDPGEHEYVAPAESGELAEPEFALDEDRVEGDTRHLRFRVASRRGAPVAQLFLPPEVKLLAASVDGTQVPARNGELPGCLFGWHMIQLLTLPPGGSTVTLELRAPKPFEMLVWDSAPGLPPEGERLREARDQVAIPFEEGDQTVVGRRVKL